MDCMSEFKLHDYNRLLEKYFENKATPEECRILINWISENQGKQRFETMCEEKWAHVSQKMDKNTENDIWQSIVKEISHSPITEQPVSENSITKSMNTSFFKRKSFSIYHIAASFFLPLLISFSLYLYFNQASDKNGERKCEFVADYGQKASMTLPDGTKVWLNSASRLSYDNKYNDEERRIYLDGEAYFEVHPDKKRKFVVDCNGLNVEALGTTFNVKGYSSDPSVTTSLLEGSVKIYNNKQTVMLTPDECVSYHKTLGRFDKSIIEDSREIDSWRRNVLYFRSASLEEIAKTLERMYGVEIKFKAEELKNIPFSGSIRNNSLSNVFYIISLTYPLTYELDKDIVIIDKK